MRIHARRRARPLHDPCRACFECAAAGVESERAAPWKRLAKGAAVRVAGYAGVECQIRGGDGQIWAEGSTVSPTGGRQDRAAGREEERGGIHDRTPEREIKLKQKYWGKGAGPPRRHGWGAMPSDGAGGVFNKKK